MPTYLLLMGGPGAGKGTQAQVLREKYGLPQVASGDLFRDNLKRETPLGQMARQYMDRGELVPDDVTIAMVRERLQQPDAAARRDAGWFPAHAAAGRGARRAAGRVWRAGEPGAVHQSARRRCCWSGWPAAGFAGARRSIPITCCSTRPSRPGVCDVDGTELYQRADDTAEVQSRRINVFFEQTAPLIAFYQSAGCWREIDGEQPIDAGDGRYDWRRWRPRSKRDAPAEAADPGDHGRRGRVWSARARASWI